MTTRAVVVEVGDSWQVKTIYEDAAEFCDAVFNFVRSDPYGRKYAYNMAHIFRRIVEANEYEGDIPAEGAKSAN